MWKNIFGHKNQIEQLKKSIKGKRVAHAFLFSGIEGIGKRLVAQGLIEALECSKSDSHLIEATGRAIKIDQIRELKQKIYLHPLEGETKTVLIDKPELMTEATANALLKILEEPPSQTYFILVSSQALRLLPTIRSRCQQINFNPLSAEEIEKYLIDSGVATAEAHARSLAAEGSLKAALEFAAEFSKTAESDLQKVLDNPTPSKIFELSEQWTQEEEKIPLLLSTLNHLWHQKIVTADAAVAGRYLREWQTIQTTRQSLEGYVNKQLLFENLLFSLSDSRARS